MTLYDEINLLLEKLTELWGSVAIACDKDACSVSDGNGEQFTAPTLIQALRLAENATEMEGRT